MGIIGVRRRLSVLSVAAGVCFFVGPFACVRVWIRERKKLIVIGRHHVLRVQVVANCLGEAGDGV